MCQLGRNLQAHKSVPSFQPVVDGAEEIGGALDIFHSDHLVDFLDVFALQGQGPDRMVIVVAARDGLFENGRIRGQAAGSILIDELLKLSIIQGIASQKIESDTLPEPLQIQ